MGAINYYTSDYITLGVNCNDIEYDFDYDIINDIYDEIESILNGENFYYFHVRLRPGYYEGFSIDIEFNFGYCLDTWEDRRAAQKEITRIKQFLITCINDFSLCAVSPGWCTSYYDYNKTIEKLKTAIKEMREKVNDTPTWMQANGERIA